MIADLDAVLPDGLSALAAPVEIGPGSPRSRRPAALRDTIAGTGTLFAGAYDGSDRRAVASLWSMYYLTTLIVPAVAALLCLDRILPVGFDTVQVDLDRDGRVARLWLPDSGAIAGDDASPFARLVDGHLVPFVALCSGASGLSPRVLWNNAAVIVDYAVNELAAFGTPEPAKLRHAQALLAGDTSASAGPSPLALPFRAGRNSRSCERRLCCLRYRLPGIEPCAGLCPLRRRGAFPPRPQAGDGLSDRLSEVG